MTEYQDAEDEKRREQRRQRIEARREQRRQRIETNRRRMKVANRVVFTFAIVVLVALIAFNVHDYLDRPRVEAHVTKVVEDRGGKVVKIVHGTGRATPRYVEVILDGETTRCLLHLLDQEPPVFDCDPDLGR